MSAIRSMHRENAIARLDDSEEIWDILIIGGGATGLGAALDAASRGHRTALIDVGDLGCGTSSRSTKLIHGGLRYLRQAEFALVSESLRERKWLLANAPQFVRPLRFIVPTFTWWDSWQYRIGLKIYDALARLETGQRSAALTRPEMSAAFPTLQTSRLRGGVAYLDAQFNDSQFLICLAKTAATHGAAIANYVAAREFIRQNGRISGVIVEDVESGLEMRLRARAVVNATGVSADTLRQLDCPKCRPLMRPSQGTHIVLDRSFFPGRDALMIPRTDDGRLLFAIPWMNHVLIGTTDTPIDHPASNPVPQHHEIAYLLDHISRYLTKPPEMSDVRSCFAGLRPLVSSDGSDRTSRISRNHHLEISDSGLITMTGGKWTTFRVMGTDAIDAAERIGRLEKADSRIHELPLVIGQHIKPVLDAQDWSSPLGAVSADELRSLEASNPAFVEELDAHLGLKISHVVHACRNEMARTVEDVLSRRIRLLYTDARRAASLAPRVADQIAIELNRDSDWRASQITDFQKLTQVHIPVQT